MITKGAHHFSIDVADVTVSRSFYGELLGLSEIERPDFGLPGVWYQAGPVQLHLIQVPEGVEVGVAEAPQADPNSASAASSMKCEPT